MSTQDYWIDDRGRYRWATSPVTGKQVTFMAEDIRRERTGIHATIYIGIEDALLDQRFILSYDTFNVTRAEERVRLANRATKATTNSVSEDYPSEGMTHDLDLFCLNLTRRYEESLFHTVSYGADMIFPTLGFPIYPFIIEGGGSIFYAPPGAGKSYTMQAMAMELNEGGAGLFMVEPHPVLYINLERSEQSMMRRHAMILKALGYETSSVNYLHARGQSLKAVEGTVRKYLRETESPVLFLDSLSRAQTGGSLNDDTTANRFTDLMNSFGCTWAAIGHAPRADTTHVYGSIHQDAGADIMVKVSSEHHSTLNKLGVQLKITKANDVRNQHTYYYSYVFGEEHEGLVAIETATENEWPTLGKDADGTKKEQVFAILQRGTIEVDDIERETGFKRNYITTILNELKDEKKPRAEKRSMGRNAWSVPDGYYTRENSQL